MSQRFMCTARMPAAVSELVEKNNAVIRMNKAKAYRELQKRQGRTIRCVWSEVPSANSYESATYRQGNSIINKSTALEADSNRYCSAMFESENIQNTDCGGRFMANSMFSINNQRPMSRSRLGSKQKSFYTEPGRPITAPEANPYATLDGSRQEAMVIPLYPPKACSVRSNSDTQSLNDYNGKRQSSNRKHRQSVDLSQSIDCNNNTPLKPRNQNELLVGEAIQYPAASKMREMLATDSSTPMERPVVEVSNTSNMKRASQVSFASRLSTQAQPSLHNEIHVSKASVSSQQTTTNMTSTGRAHPVRSVTSIPRRSSLSKQVSFVDKNETGNERHSTNTASTEPEEPQPLALTTKNLNMYNAMILKTIRTSKFDERIVQWVKERQCDQKSRIPRHDAIPEVDETGYSDNIGRVTPNKRDHTGGRTPRESERTIHITSPTVYQSAEPSHSINQSGQSPHNAPNVENVKHMKPTSLPTATEDLVTSNGLQKPTADEKLSDKMSAKTNSNDKPAEGKLVT